MLKTVEDYNNPGLFDEYFSLLNPLSLPSPRPFFGDDDETSQASLSAISIRLTAALLS
jgi:hypothetical protein